MGRYITLHISYRVDYTPERVQRLSLALKQAIDENWACHSDQWSLPEPPSSVIDALAARDPTLAQPESLKEVWIADDMHFRELLDDNGKQIRIPYSPVSIYSPILVVHQTLALPRENKLELMLIVRDSIRYEREANVAHQNMYWEVEENPHLLDDDAWCDRYDYLGNLERSVWPINKACLVNIVEHLKRLWPVDRIEIDEEGEDISAEFYPEGLVW